MAKQTFTTGQVLTAAQMTSLQQTAMLGGDASAKVASYVLVAADAGTAISMSNGSATTITVNTGLFAAGDIVTIVNLGAGVCTITAGTATVATSGSLALAQNQGGVLRFTSASAAIFFQFATPASGDIEGVTAGTGISGGGTSGTVTITNSMATTIDAKGDLIVGTGADAFARLAVGTNGHTLVADSAETTGLKWAAPAAGGGLTLLSTTTLSGSSTSVTSISGSYKNLLIQIDGVGLNTTSGSISMTVNSNTSNYQSIGLKNDGPALVVSSSRIPLSGNDNTNDTGGDNQSSTVILFNYTSSKYKTFQWTGTYLQGGSNFGTSGGGGWSNTAAITSIQVVTSAGSFASGGSIKIYGEN